MIQDEDLMGMPDDSLVSLDNLDNKDDQFEPAAAYDSTQIAAAKNTPQWYILHTYSGYENMVKDNLERVFVKNNIQDRLIDLKIPDEDVVEEKNGKRKIVKRRMFPSYVFIKMDYDNSMWHMITRTRGVTGFVGPQGRPLPLSEEEIKKMRLEMPVVVESDIVVGTTVRVISGSLDGFEGTVSSIDLQANKAKIKVNMFGRLTDVDIELYQIEKI